MGATSVFVEQDPPTSGAAASQTVDTFITVGDV